MAEQDTQGRALPPGEQPPEQPEGPSDQPRLHHPARRSFLYLLLLTSLALVVGQLWVLVQGLLRRWRGQPLVRAVAALEPSHRRLPHLPVGGSVAVNYPDATDLCLVVRLAEDTLVAYDQKCTHLACPVQPDVAAGKLVCPCHGGVFDLATGKQLKGPPKRPLPRIGVEVREGLVWVTGAGGATS
jgi:Rieske Fe-S protein